MIFKNSIYKIGKAVRLHAFADASNNLKIYYFKNGQTHLKSLSYLAGNLSSVVADSSSFPVQEIMPYANDGGDISRYEKYWKIN